MDPSLVTCPTRINATTVGFGVRRRCYGTYLGATTGDFVGFGEWPWFALRRCCSAQTDHHDVTQHGVQVEFYGQVDRLCAVTSRSSLRPAGSGPADSSPEIFGVRRPDCVQWWATLRIAASSCPDSDHPLAASPSRVPHCYQGFNLIRRHS